MFNDVLEISLDSEKNHALLTMFRYPPKKSELAQIPNVFDIRVKRSEMDVDVWGSNHHIKFYNPNICTVKKEGDWHRIVCVDKEVYEQNKEFIDEL